MANEFKFRWAESGETVKQYTEPVRSRGHADPTVDATIGHIIAEEKRERRRKERQKQRKKNGYRPTNTGMPRTSVWRKSDEENNVEKIHSKRLKNRISQPYRTEGSKGGKPDA